MKLFGRRTKTENGGPTVVLHVEGMHCNSCGLLIDDELEELTGVHSAATDVPAGRTTISLEDGVEVDIATLIAAVERAGEYKARPVD